MPYGRYNKKGATVAGIASFHRGRNSRHVTTLPCPVIHLNDGKNEASANRRSWAGKKKMAGQRLKVKQRVSKNRRILICYLISSASSFIYSSNSLAKSFLSNSFNFITCFNVFSVSPLLIWISPKAR